MHWIIELLPTASVLLGAVHYRRTTIRTIRSHNRQVNTVIQWAIEQQPPAPAAHGGVNSE